MNEDEQIKVINAITESLDALYLPENEGFAIKRKINERTLVSHFAIYFEPLIKAIFPDYFVDCEYNRNFSEPKILNSWSHGCFPDLIVHKRESNSNNKIVIEFKTWWNSSQYKDHKKVAELCDACMQYKYTYGFCILLAKERKNVRIEVFQNSTDGSKNHFLRINES